MSRPPSCSPADSTKRRPPSGVEMSATMPTASRPISATAASTRSCVRPQIATRTPSAASAFADPSPSPAVAAATAARLPAIPSSIGPNVQMSNRYSCCRGHASRTLTVPRQCRRGNLEGATHMKRLFTIALLGASLTIGATACGSDDKPASTTAKSETTAKASETTAKASETTAKGSATTAKSGDSASAVADYCNDVKAFVADVKAAGKDSAKLAALQSKATELVQSGTKLATSGLSADDTKALQDCTTEAGKAFTG